MVGVSIPEISGCSIIIFTDIYELSRVSRELFISTGFFSKLCDLRHFCLKSDLEDVGSEDVGVLKALCGTTKIYSGLNEV